MPSPYASAGKDGGLALSIEAEFAENFRGMLSQSRGRSRQPPRRCRQAIRRAGTRQDFSRTMGYRREVIPVLQLPVVNQIIRAVDRTDWNAPRLSGFVKIRFRARQREW